MMSMHKNGRPCGAGSWTFDWRKVTADHWKDMLFSTELGWRKEHVTRVWSALHFCAMLLVTADRAYRAGVTRGLGQLCDAIEPPADE